jgi:hypothetical protein
VSDTPSKALIWVSYFDPTSGHCLQARTLMESEIEAYAPSGAVHALGRYTYDDHHWSEGEVKDRPAGRVIPETVTMPHVIDLSGLPPGTAVTIINEAREELHLLDPTENVELPDPGIYYLRIEPSWPHKPSYGRIEVTA